MKLLQLAAAIVGTVIFGSGSQTPPPGTPPVNTVLPQIIGLDTTGSVLSVDNGTWTNSPTSYTYSWHMIDNTGGVLGTGPTLTLTAPMICATTPSCGRLQVDVTAHNTAGTGVVTSDFIGPVEASLPASPPITPGPAPSALPVYPANFIENGHAIYPGCDIPPVSPTTTPANVWYFDTVNGHTQDSGATGHAGDPFNNPTAIFSSGQSGYSGGALFARTIHAGDAIYIKANPSGASVGTFTASNVYSTSNGLSTGTPVWTWIIGDPTGVGNPVFGPWLLNNMGGFVFKNLNSEVNALDYSTFSVNSSDRAVDVRGTPSAPSFDLVFEGMSLTSWKGHSNDARDPSTYPSSGGHSDGTIITASPYVGPQTNGTQEYQITASLGATKIFFVGAGIPVVVSGVAPNYVFSPGYYYQYQWPSFPSVAPSNTGIPNGTIIKDFNGNAAWIPQGAVATSASLPGTVTNNNAWFAQDTKHLWVGVGGVWTDEGAAYADIGPCSASTDAATGCPTTNYAGINSGPASNIPQCDPLIVGNASPGGCGTTVTAWSGTTRAITNEYADFVGFIHITPNGWWNHIDWDYTVPGLSFLGGLNAAPNDVEGMNCISAKNNTVRWDWNQIDFGAATNSIAYGNFLKYRTGDAFKVYSSHRVIVANNFSSDTTYILEHQDILQYAAFLTNNAFFYGNSAVNNEGYSVVDTNNQFPQSTQPIGVTDEVFSGTYVADNIIVNSNNPLGIAGLYNVSVNNTTFADNFPTGAAGGEKVISGTKTNVNQPAFSMLSNNLSNYESRNILVPGVYNTSPGINIQSISGGTMTLTTTINQAAGWVGPWTVTSSAPGFPASVVVNVPSGSGFSGTSIPVTASGGYSSAVSGITVTSIAGSPQKVMTLTNPATIPSGATVTSTDVGWPASVVTTAACNSCTTVNVTASGLFTGPGSAGAASSTGATATVAASGFCSQDSNTVNNNLGVSVIAWSTGSPSTGNATYCGQPTGPVSNSSLAGIFADYTSWASADWRTNGAAANPLFNDMDPISPGPSVTKGAEIMAFSPCLRNAFSIGTCAHNDPGRMDLRPNAAFVSTSTALTCAAGTGYQCMISAVSLMPTTGGIGDKILLQSSSVCGNGFTICGGVYGGACASDSIHFVNCTFPPGIYTRINSGTTMAAYGSVAQPFSANQSPFNPGPIGAGLNLGAQMPPANHDRAAWTSPPNVGAY